MSNVGRSAFGVADVLRYNEWHIDSSEYTYGTINTPTFSLQREFNNLIGFKVIECQIPFSYYVFQSGRNTFTLTEPTSSATGTVTIPPGNYTPTSIAQVLKTELEAIGDATYTVTYSNTTGKLSVTSSVAEAFVLTFPTIGTSEPAKWLGFQYGANTATAGGVLEAPYIARLSGDDYIYICSKALGMFNNDTLRRGDTAQSGPIIAKVPVNVNPGGVILWADPDPTKFFEVDVSVLTNTDFYIVKGWDISTPLDFNGAPFSLKVSLITTDGTSAKRGSGALDYAPAKRSITSF